MRKTMHNWPETLPALARAKSTMDRPATWLPGAAAPPVDLVPATRVLELDRENAELSHEVNERRVTIEKLLAYHGDLTRENEELRARIVELESQVATYRSHLPAFGGFV